MGAARAVSNEARYSAEEWRIRTDLAACYRLAARFGWSEIIYTHITARVPGAGDLFLINPFGLCFEEVTASNLIKVDVAGRIMEPTDHAVQEAGFVIHSAIHMARPEIACVLHNHTPAGIAISMLEDGLLPLSQHAMMFHDRIAYHDSEGFAVDLAERRRLAEDLGDKPLMILRNHGVLLAAKSVAEAFSMMFNLEKAMQAQLMAMATGGRLVRPPAAVGAQIASMVYQPGKIGYPETMEWPALLRMLDRVDPSYRN